MSRCGVFEKAGAPSGEVSIEARIKIVGPLRMAREVTEVLLST
jgi:hypothetical protein